ncbi:MAG TPA: hypothetical protein VKY85_07740 [Candidatus Angelobacter sp.]|nr:hypothetical protein [Candidatus Angelobacter sp.]
MNAESIYQGSNGEATAAFYEALRQKGMLGVVAEHLFRAGKCSERAKQYRGGIRGQGSYRQMAYDKKNWALRELDKSLGALCLASGTSYIPWGWGWDEKTPGYSWVLYVDLPQGQVSFHTAKRGDGPSYLGQWDGVRNASAARIIAFCQWVYDGHGGRPVAVELEELPVPDVGKIEGEQIALFGGMA